MWPLLLLGVGGGLLALAWRAAKAAPPIPALLPGGPAGQADALAMLAFPAFTLEPGRATTIAYLAPGGMTAPTARASIERVIGPVDDVTLARRGVVVPPPAGPGAGPVVHADVWFASCASCGPQPPSPALVLTPRHVLEKILEKRGLPIYPAAGGVAPERQLAAILYAAALLPESDPGRRALLIPVAGAQAPPSAG